MQMICFIAAAESPSAPAGRKTPAQVREIVFHGSGIGASPARKAMHGRAGGTVPPIGPLCHRHETAGLAQEAAIRRPGRAACLETAGRRLKPKHIA